MPNATPIALATSGTPVIATSKGTLVALSTGQAGRSVLSLSGNATPIVLPSTTFVPSAATSATLVGTLDFENLSSLSLTGSSINSITDTTAAAAVFSQATGASKPVSGASVYTGRNVGKFDGVDDQLTVTGVPAAYPITGAVTWVAFAAQTADPAVSTGNRCVLAMGNSNATSFNLERAVSSSVNRSTVVTASNANLGPTTPWTGPAMVVGRWGSTGNATEAALNTVFGAKTTNALPNNNTRARIGVRSAATPTNFFQGEISCILIYSGALSQMDINNLFLWGKARIGL